MPYLTCRSSSVCLTVGELLSCADCLANTFPNPERTMCTACAAETFSAPGSGLCCPRMDACEASNGVGNQHGYYIAGGTVPKCDGRASKSTSTPPCRAANPALCLPEVRCTGFKPSCDVNTETESVVSQPPAGVTVLGGGDGSDGSRYFATLSAVRLKATGATVTCGPPLTPALYAIGVVRSTAGCAGATASSVTTWSRLPATADLSSFPLPSAAAMPSNGAYCVFVSITGYKNVLEKSTSTAYVSYSRFPGTQAAGNCFRGAQLLVLFDGSCIFWCSLGRCHCADVVVINSGLASPPQGSISICAGGTSSPCPQVPSVCAMGPADCAAQLTLRWSPVDSSLLKSWTLTVARTRAGVVSDVWTAQPATTTFSAPLCLRAGDLKSWDSLTGRLEGVLKDGSPFSFPNTAPVTVDTTPPAATGNLKPVNGPALGRHIAWATSTTSASVSLPEIVDNTTPVAAVTISLIRGLSGPIPNLVSSGPSKNVVAAPVATFSASTHSFSGLGLEECVGFTWQVTVVNAAGCSAILTSDPFYVLATPPVLANPTVSVVKVCGVTWTPLGT